jgi:hypothetical protein
MRDRVEIAKRLLSVRATVRELEQGGAGHSGASPAAALESARLLAFRASAQALAWVLDIDLNQIDIPQTLLSLEEQPTTVQLHRLELGEPPHTLVMWLAEIPAHHDASGPDYSTESWSCFLQDEQARQFLAALTTALRPPARAPLHLPLLGQPGALHGISQSQGQSAAPLSPVSPPAPPDVEGGYADYAGLAAFADDQDDQDDDQDEPPATAASGGGRGSRR